ncbi:small integral membrane protein 24 [Excalfactoria chinensis]|uniref:small integral membrane protein 24 n=1 Tax=Excalfactoria chinensis TaxID=46218 RepID=UPI003B3BB4F8
MVLVALGGTRPAEPHKSCPLSCCGAQCRAGISATMLRVPQLRALLLLAALSATAQGQTVGSQQLQPWLIALTAVVVFLFVVFVLLLVGRLLRLRTRREHEDGSERRSTHSMERAAAYSNAAAEKDSDDERDKSKATAL